MKSNKAIKVLVILVLVGGLAFLALRGVSADFNRLNAEVYYTKLVSPGKEIEDKDVSNGDVYIRYEYNLPSYTKNGKEKDLTFTASKELKQDAYLKVFYKESKGVTSYEEVTYDKLPEKVQEKLPQ